MTIIDAAPPLPQVFLMSMTRTDLTDTELADIARDAALRVPGLGTVEAVRVTTGQDSEDRPTHVFSLLIERNRNPWTAGLARIRLVQAIRDVLIDHGDPQPPTIRVLDHADWHRHEGA